MEHGFSRKKRKKKDKIFLLYNFVIRENQPKVRLVCVPFHFIEMEHGFSRKGTEEEG
jgi:hypothetical protein